MFISMGFFQDEFFTIPGLLSFFGGSVFLRHLFSYDTNFYDPKFALFRLFSYDTILTPSSGWLASEEHPSAPMGSSREAAPGAKYDPSLSHAVPGVCSASCGSK